MWCGAHGLKGDVAEPKHRRQDCKRRELVLRVDAHPLHRLRGSARIAIRDEATVSAHTDPAQMWQR